MFVVCGVCACVRMSARVRYLYENTASVIVAGQCYIYIFYRSSLEGRFVKRFFHNSNDDDEHTRCLKESE